MSLFYLIHRLRDIGTFLENGESTRDTQKLPGMVVLHCSGRTYGNAYIINFKVGPLGNHTLAHLILSLLEVPVEGHFWSLPEFGRHIQFDILDGCDFFNGEQPMVTPISFRVTFG